jgi:hypothetical protein
MATDVLVSEQTGHALIKCKDCKKVGRIDFTVTTETRAFNGRPSYSSSALINGRTHRLNAYNTLDGVLYKYADHGCDGRSLKVNRVKGIFVADKPCDARCMGATGPNCSCSCGGENHGGSHSAW